jgi:hypothetical protein
LKKLAAILLLILFLFHLIGYRAVFYLLEQQWQQQVQLSLDKEEYNESELITIKAPLMLPYVTDTKEFQRTDGEITVDGKLYRYVKSKVENGVYVLLCLPDHYQQKLEKGKHAFISYNTDLSVNDGNKKNADSKATAFKLPVTESGQHYFTIDYSGYKKSKGHFHLTQSPMLASTPHHSPEQPPDYYKA